MGKPKERYIEEKQLNKWKKLYIHICFTERVIGFWLKYDTNSLIKKHIYKEEMERKKKH